MNHLNVCRRLFGVLGAILLASAASTQPPETVVVQGQLLDSGGAPLSGTRDYLIRFFDDPAAGAQLGADLSGQTLVSAEGLFAIPLVPPAAVLGATQAWYELALDSAATPDGLDANDVFPNRVRVHSVPFAQVAGQAMQVDVENVGDGSISQSELTSLNGVSANLQSQLDDKANAADVYTKSEVDASQAAQDTEISNRVTGDYVTDAINDFSTDVYNEIALKADADHTHSASDIISGELNDARIPATIARMDDVWQVGGNSSTASGLLGTNSNQTLELFANSQILLRLEPNATSPNVIAGSPSNSVTAGVVGANIGGGGTGGSPNRVTDNYGVVGGGFNNRAGDNAGTTADRPYAVVAGGQNNIASNAWSAVLGGYNNNASGDTSTVAGGDSNTASGTYATAIGGINNTASGTYSFAAGRRAKANHNGAFVWGDSTNADIASTIANEFTARASGGVRLFTGQGALRIEASGSTPNFIAGHTENNVTATVNGATIAGGGVSGSPNRVTDAFGVVSGGADNQAGDGAGTVLDRIYGTVGGGLTNTASGAYSFIGGGSQNVASGQNAAIGGGSQNSASAYCSTIAGGAQNTANNSQASVLGGNANLASGAASTVAGGYWNTAAGSYSFAAGKQARANHSGSFVWGDNSGASDIASSANNQFTARTAGGARFYTSADLSTGVTLAAGGGSWSSVSDKNVKENLRQVDAEEVLEKVAGLDISTWNYMTQDESIRHIGPMAQDFYAAFGVGESDTSITTVDAHGVALAAIQGLNEKLNEKDAEIAALKERLEAIEKAIAAQ